MNIMTMQRFLIITAAALAITGCATKRDRIPPEPMGTPGGGGQVSTGPNAPAPGSQEDFVANTASDRIFFNTDKFDVDPEDMEILKSQASWLQRYPNVRVTVEGHCDERGTRDYNLALGERRANAAKNYLASLGIAPDRITTISYGKERPDAVGSNEEAWARNRRAVSVTVR
jgi:peptidoglycan-associated lipoprotein